MNVSPTPCKKSRVKDEQPKVGVVRTQTSEVSLGWRDGTVSLLEPLPTNPLSLMRETCRSVLGRCGREHFQRSSKAENLQKLGKELWDATLLDVSKQLSDLFRTNEVTFVSPCPGSASDQGARHVHDGSFRNVQLHERKVGSTFS